ncbi:MAG: DUF1232 domain-containing protein [Chloroflexota bacterium]
MTGRLGVLFSLLRTGRLAWRLVLDGRTPIGAKLILVATVAYLVFPMDFVADWIPALGQADDLLVLLAGLHAFIKACPDWLVRWHENPDKAPGDVIDGQYRVVK